MRRKEPTWIIVVCMVMLVLLLAASIFLDVQIVRDMHEEQEVSPAYWHVIPASEIEDTLHPQ